MAEILQMFSIVRRLLAPESFPWSELTLTTNMQKLRERYKFAEIGQAAPVGTPSSNHLLASGGEYSVGATIAPIQQLLIGPNIIQFQVAGDSGVADAFYEGFAEFLKELAPKAPLSEYARTYQTVTVVKLNVPFEAAFSEGLKSFLSDSVAPLLALEDAEADLRFSNLSWQVTYRKESADYVYMPKVLTIEPRAGSKLSDQVYYVQTPTDSKKHIELLARFERTFSKGAPRAGSASLKKGRAKRNSGKK